jgi:hypothetical protein
VVQEADGFSGMRCFHGAGERAILVAEFTPRLIALQQRFCDTGMPNHFVAGSPRYVFCSVAPQYDFLLHVDDAESCRHAFQDAATDLGIVKCRHGLGLENSSDSEDIGRNSQGHQSAKMHQNRGIL